MRQQRACFEYRCCLRQRFAASFGAFSGSSHRHSRIFGRGAFAPRAASFVTASEGGAHQYANALALLTHRGAVASIVVASKCVRSKRSAAQQTVRADRQQASACWSPRRWRGGGTTSALALEKE